MINNSEIVKEIYGYWPDFHDAEILSINLESDRENRNVKITTIINYFESKQINEGTAQFETVRDKDNLITLQFDDVSNSNITGFNFQNVIEELVINQNGAVTEVIFYSSYGASIELKCKTITVVQICGA